MVKKILRWTDVVACVILVVLAVRFGPRTTVWYAGLFVTAVSLPGAGRGSERGGSGMKPSARASGRRALLVVSALASLAVAQAPAPLPEGKGTVQQENMRVVRRLHEDVWTNGNLAAVDELIGEGFTAHFPGGDWQGVAEFKQRVARLRSAFPDWSETEEDAFADGSKVVSRWTSRGTHRGEFLGLPATGRRVVVTEMAIYRIVAGKVVERWSEVDRLGMLQQLGALPQFPTPAARSGR